jgi:hypothetical protein
MIKKLGILIAAASLFSTCQYRIDTPVQPTSKQYLVINAELTENYGKVLVENSIPKVETNGSYVEPDALDAKIYVLDSKGNRSNFANDGIENYNFQGKIGETYRLFVEVNGNKYESLPEKMPACPEIDSVSSTFRQDQDLRVEDLLYNGFDINLFTRDLPEEGNAYQWDWIHYQRAAFCGSAPDFRFKGREAGLPCISDCWEITRNTKTLIQTDKLTNGKNLKVNIVRIPYIGPPYKYYLRVEQRGIPKSVVEYFAALKTQTQTNGTLFDVPAQTVFNPNIKGVTKTDEKILGVFNVFSSRRKVIYIDMTKNYPNANIKLTPDLLPAYTSIPIIAKPCEEGRYRTGTRPEGWID